MAAKRHSRKRSGARKAHPKRSPVIVHVNHPHEVHHQNHERDKVLIENFVTLQRVMTNMSIKMDNLTNQISKLVEIFEISAKALAEKDFEVDNPNKELIEKIDNLLNQNKTLARGLALMHERIPREPQVQQIQSFQPSQFSPQTLQPPQFTPQFKPIERNEMKLNKPSTREISSETENSPFEKSNFEPSM